MQRIVLWAMSTLTVLVLLLGYRTSLSGPTATAGAPSPYSASAPAAAASSTTGSGSGSGSRQARTAESGSASGSGSTSVTGSTVSTRYGPVQVQLTVEQGTITAAQVLQYPSGDPRSAQISSYALPTLVQETVDQQSSQIDMVSGATYTSMGYEQSLQSALDQAGL